MNQILQEANSNWAQTNFSPRECMIRACELNNARFIAQAWYEGIVLHNGQEIKVEYTNTNGGSWTIA